MGDAVAVRRDGGRTRALDRGLVVQLACTVAIALVAWPVWTLEPVVTFDFDWAAGLAYAAEHRLRFGDEIAFTFGPLGFLHTAPIGPALFYDRITALELLFAAILQLLLAGALLFALRRSLPLVVAAVAAAVVLALVPDRVLALGFVLCVLRLTRAHEARDRLAAATPIALGVLAGILLLGKLNQGIELLVLACVALAALPRRRDALAFALALLATLAAGWLGTGQTPADVWPYLRNGAEIIAGYAAAMGLEESSFGWTYPVALLMTAAVLALAWSVGRGWTARLRWGLVGLVLVYAAFAFKEGFVRHDAIHLAGYFGDMLVPFAALPAPRLRRAVPVVAIAAIVAGFWVAEGSHEVGRALNPYANVSAVVDQARTLVSEARREQIKETLRTTVASTYEIPPQLIEVVDDHSVMLWPLMLTEVAYANDLNLRPLPTLEPYSTYTPALDRLGARMLDERGPELIIRVAGTLRSSLDGRNPSFEAPLVTLGILCRYRLIASQPPWHLLVRSPDRCGAPRTVSRLDAAWGEPVAVPAPRRAEALVLVRVQGAGEQGLERLRSLLLRPRERWIALDGRRFRLVAATAADGLLLTAPARADYAQPLAMAPGASRIAVGRDGGEPDGKLHYEFVEVPIRPFDAG